MVEFHLAKMYQNVSLVFLLKIMEFHQTQIKHRALNIVAFS